MNKNKTNPLLDGVFATVAPLDVGSFTKLNRPLVGLRREVGTADSAIVNLGARLILTGGVSTSEVVTNLCVVLAAAVARAPMLVLE